MNSSDWDRSVYPPKPDTQGIKGSVSHLFVYFLTHATISRKSCRFGEGESRFIGVSSLSAKKR